MVTDRSRRDFAVIKLGAMLPSMRAWTVDVGGGLDDLVLGERAEPELAAGQVRVRVRAAALNPADLKAISGREGGRFLRDRSSPMGLGFDFAGEVEALGEGARDLELGDEVFGFLPYARSTSQGSFAERLVVDPTTVALKPASLSFAEAASLATVGSTALQVLRDNADLREGQRVLINGASGGVGSHAVEVARALGAGEIWGTCGPSNLDYLRELGVDRAVNYRETALADLDGDFDVVFDAAAKASFSTCRKILRPGGAYLTLLPSPAFLLGKVASALSSKRCIFVAVSPKRADLEQLARWVEDGKLSSHLLETLSFEQLPEGLKKLGDGVRGKLALTVD